MHFISFYYDSDPSVSTYYYDCYVNLKKQLEKLNYNFSIEKLDIENPNYKTINFHKPLFIENKIKELNDSVVWIDIDCSFIRPVDELKDLTCDVGLFMRNKKYDIGTPYYETGTPHACLMFFNNTKKSLNFIRPWRDICEKSKSDSSIRETEHAYLINYYRSGEYDKTEFCFFEDYCTSDINRITNEKVFVGISQGGINYEKGMCGWENKSI